MSGWVKLMTNFYRHPKALAAGPDGRNLFIASVVWAGEYNTDGALPAYALSTWALDAGVPGDNAGQVADKLVEVRLWDRTPEGWQVHDWADWQTSAAERDEKQRRERERKAAWRAKRSVVSRGTDAGHDADATRQSPLSEAETETETENTPPTPPGDIPPVVPSSRYKRALNAVAWARAKAEPGVRSVNGLQRTIVREAEDTGLADQLRTLISDHPTATDSELVALLDAGPPRARYVPPDPKEVMRALKGGAA